MIFSRQEYWSGLPCPPPGDLPSQPRERTLSLVSPALASGFFTSATWEALVAMTQGNLKKGLVTAPNSLDYMGYSGSNAGKSNHSPITVSC